MKNFQFSFQKVLDIKEKGREQVEWSYARLIHTLNQATEKLAELISNKDKLLEQIVNTQIEGVSIKAINESQPYINYLDQQIHMQIDKIKQIKKSILEKQKQLIELKIDEKKWSMLREKKFEEYQLELNQFEQKELDEIATIRSYK